VLANEGYGLQPVHSSPPNETGLKSPREFVSEPKTIRVVLPQHLRTLAGAGAEVTLAIAAPITICRILDALEAAHPMLRGTIRDYATGQRRPFLRFFVCEEDWSLLPLDTDLPPAIAEGREPLLIIGAIAGG